MLDSPFIIIPFLLNFYMIIVGPMIYISDIEDEIGFKIAVVPQIWIKYNLEDELTNLGVIILQVIASIIFLPYTIIVGIAITIKYIIGYFWHWYKYIFRKRSENEALH